MSETAVSRGYAWGVQTDYQTQKPLAANALRKLIVTDKNFIDYSVATNSDEDWSHGYNYKTDQWLETHDAKVQHTMPGHSQELGRVFLLNLGNYAVATPAGGTTSKDHTFKPQDPFVSRQNKAVTYAERTGAGWNVLMPSAVADGFSLKGDGTGILMCDFGLQGAGKIVNPSGVNWATHVVQPTGLHKLFNTQVGLSINDGGGAVNYGCRYRSFSIDFKQNLLLDAGFKPGCTLYQTPGDTTSGLIRSESEFDKQMLDFSFEIDMGAGAPELTALQQQKPLNIIVTATGGIIETTIRHKIVVTIPVGKYSVTKPTEKNGIMALSLSGSALFDFTSNSLFSVVLTNDVASYLTGW